MASGGVLIPLASHFDKIQVALKKYETLLIADEVICAFGCTGKIFGNETFGLKPDMITLAKQLSALYQHTRPTTRHVCVASAGLGSKLRRDY